MRKRYRFEYFYDESIRNLALCPICSAKYQEFIQKDDIGERPRFRKALMDADANDDAIKIPITLGKEEITVRFTQAHFIDIQTLLRKQKSDDHSPRNSLVEKLPADY